jgi:hypothetical protein
MGVVITPESELGKEMAKWERPERGGTRPYVYVPFPRMLYKARKRPDGRVMCMDPADESFSAQCWFVVQNELELEKAHREGWRDSPKEALDYFEGLERDIARAAAERAYSDQRLTEKARAEAAAAEAETPEHVPDIPRRGPGRPRKIVA